MEQNLKRFLFLVCISLNFVLMVVLVALSYMAPAFRYTFVTYQFFLVGVCVGALALATVGLIVERTKWIQYKTYFAVVMLSVFLLAVVNSVVFRILGGEQFLRKLVSDFLFFLNVG